MKFFEDKKAVRTFGELYMMLSEDQKTIMGQMVRDLAKQKVEGDGDEFYVTWKDIYKIYKSISEKEA